MAAETLGSSFDQWADAVRFLVFVLANRFQVPAPGFAPAASYVAEGDVWVLSWPGGRAVSPGGRLDPEHARQFSWVATADPADIAAGRIPVLRLRESGDPG